MQLCMGKNLTLQDTLIRLSSFKPDVCLSNAYVGLTLSSSVILISLHLSHINKTSNRQHTSHICHSENTQKDLVVAVAYCGTPAMHLPSYPE